MDHTLLLESRRQLSSIASITGAGYYYAIGSSGKRFMCYVFTVTSHKGAWKIYRRCANGLVAQRPSCHVPPCAQSPLPRPGSPARRTTVAVVEEPTPAALPLAGATGTASSTLCRSALVPKSRCLARAACSSAALATTANEWNGGTKACVRG